MAAIFPIPVQIDDRHAPRMAPTRPEERGAGTVVRLDPGRGRRVRRAIRRRNLTLVAAVTAALVVTIFTLAVGFAVVDSLSQPPAVTPVTGPGAADTGGVIVVQSGDTLTSIARRLQPTGDVSALVERLAAVHGPAPLQAGDRLPIAELGIAPGDLAS